MSRLMLELMRRGLPAPGATTYVRLVTADPLMTPQETSHRPRREPGVIDMEAAETTGPEAEARIDVAGRAYHRWLETGELPA